MRGLPIASTVSVNRGFPSASESDTLAERSSFLPTKTRLCDGGAEHHCGYKYSNDQFHKVLRRVRNALVRALPHAQKGHAMTVA